MNISEAKMYFIYKFVLLLASKSSGTIMKKTGIFMLEVSGKTTVVVGRLTCVKLHVKLYDNQFYFCLMNVMLHD